MEVLVFGGSLDGMRIPIADNDTYFRYRTWDGSEERYDVRYGYNDATTMLWKFATVAGLTPTNAMAAASAPDSALTAMEFLERQREADELAEDERRAVLATKAAAAKRFIGAINEADRTSREF